MEEKSFIYDWYRIVVDCLATSTLTSKAFPSLLISFSVDILASVYLTFYSSSLTAEQSKLDWFRENHCRVLHLCRLVLPVNVRLRRA
jgi:hypothetical protein